MKKKPQRRHEPQRPAPREQPLLGPGRAAGSGPGPARAPAHAMHGHSGDEPGPLDVVLHDPALLDAMRERWLGGDWKAMTELSDQAVRQHPQRAQLAALRAAAALQTGDRRAARVFADQALAWGCARADIGRLLIGGMRQTLARASYAARREVQADALFEKSVGLARLSSEVRRLAQQRRDRVADDVKAAVAGARTLRRGNALPASATAPGWLTSLADQCMSADDLHQALDRVQAELLSTAAERAQFLLLVADRFLARDDRMSALHHLGSVRAMASELDDATRTELSRRLVALGAGADAMDMLLEAAVATSATDPAVAAALRSSFDKLRSGASVVAEHGHELVLAFLDGHLGTLQSRVRDRPLTLVEIGTTREDVPGQGSTRKLAQYCMRNRMHFITVDMDPHNSEMARKVFANLGAAFEAVTMKGEDFLARFTGQLDLVFLDAYDFDHGKHSELRQSRYEKFLGARIDDEACHRMHLDCAQTLAAKLPPWGAVVIDDTWVEDGRWMAKGTTAMPFLLANGFRLMESRNRAATLVRTGFPAAA